MNRVTTQRIALGVCIAGIALLASCQSSEPAHQPAPTADTRTEAPTTEAPPKHWVQDTQLRRMMDLISKQTSAVPEGNADVESPPGFIKNQEFDQVATLAEGLSNTALEIPNVPGRARLNEADRQGFDAQAKTLHDLAEQLKTAANAHQIERMQTTMTTITATCTACHTRYRDLTGFLDPRAALDVQ
jgi:hypothetical protein